MTQEGNTMTTIHIDDVIKVDGDGLYDVLDIDEVRGVAVVAPRGDNYCEFMALDLIERRIAEGRWGLARQLSLTDLLDYTAA